MGDQGSVLIVEDEAALAELFEIWLSDRYTVETATTGAAAIDRLDDTIDVIVLDWRMPDISGADVLAHIRAEGVPVDVAVVTGMELVVEDLEHESATVLCKPVSAEELVSTVDSLMDGPDSE